MKDINKFTLDAVLTKPYMSREDFYTVLPVGRKKSDKLFQDLWNELKDKNVVLFDSRPQVIPTKYFKRKYLEGKEI